MATRIKRHAEVGPHRCIFAPESCVRLKRPSEAMMLNLGVHMHGHMEDLMECEGFLEGPRK